jgi:ribosome-associated translation inhibitor RaiA
MPFKLSFKDTPHSEAVQRECESLAETLRAEFPETTRVEITLSHVRDEYDAHVHVTGKEIDLAGRAKHRDSAELAAREAFQRAHSQLRKHHDKQIFKHRRDGHEKS